jgi:hypothetical protein
MRRLVTHSLVWSLLLLFAGSGIAAHYCSAAHQFGGANAGAVQTAGVESGHRAAASGHGDHADHADHRHHGTGETQPVDIDVAGMTGGMDCAKCCGSCTIATATMPAPTDYAVFKVSPAVFAAVSQHCTGCLVRVDPGIPKRIV